MPGGQNQVITILGMKGSGKSTLAREIVMTRERVLVIDASGEYEDLPGAIVVYGARNASERLIELKDKQRWILVASDLLDDEETMHLLAVAFEVPSIMIVLEEASLYCDPYRLPDEISRIIRYGRKREIDMIIIARRPSEINRELTAQSDIVVSFKQMEPIDVSYLRARGGKEADAVQSLPPFKVIVLGDRANAPLSVLARLVGRKQLTMEDQPID
jgi:DNA helicase HerA-like ATPase